MKRQNYGQKKSPTEVGLRFDPLRSSHETFENSTLCQI